MPASPSTSTRLFLRVAAFLIDWFIIATVTAFLIEAAVHGDVEAVRHHALGVTLILLAMCLIYFTLLEGSHWQATLAKRLLRLEVRSPTPGGYRQAIVRNGARFLPLLLPYVGWLWLFVDAAFALRGERTLHDRLADTVVVVREWPPQRPPRDH